MNNHEVFFPIKDSKDYVHSIDMVYIEYYSYISPKGIIELVQQIHEKYKDLSYQEHLGRSPHSKYDYYLDGISIGGVYVSAGKYNNYDKLTGTFDLLPMVEIRVNPNKYFETEWFQELLSVLLKNVSSGNLRKYDYAIDIPKQLRFVEVLDSRKEFGLYKGTRYYGQSGRHGYLKIYDKQKDMKRQKIEIDTLTRVEHTLFGNSKPSLEDVYVLDEDSIDADYGKLNDTDRAIVEMYLRLKSFGDNYKLKLGRRKMESLRPYISGKYTLLEYGDILDRLLLNIKAVFKLDDAPESDAPTDDDEFMKISDAQQAELDELFGE